MISHNWFWLLLTSSALFERLKVKTNTCLWDYRNGYKMFYTELPTKARKRKDVSFITECLKYKSVFSSGSTRWHYALRPFMAQKQLLQRNKWMVSRLLLPAAWVLMTIICTSGVVHADCHASCLLRNDVEYDRNGVCQSSCHGSLEDKFHKGLWTKDGW